VQVKSNTLIQQTVILIGLLFVAFFLGMWSYGLSDTNEGLYAEIAREMFSGSLIIPHLNHVPYLEKPPLLYWLINLSFHLFGISNLGARMVPALSASGVCLLTWWFGRRINEHKAGWLAAIILASSVGFMIIGRVVLFDMLVTFFMTATLYNFYLWYQQQTPKYLYLTAASLALAILSKGFLALALIPAIAGTFLLLERAPLTIWLRLFNGRAIGIFLLVVMPWHVIAAIVNQDFLYQYVVNEHIFRFLDLRVPNDYHHGPISFYLPRLLVYLFPWSLLAPLVLIKNKLSSVNRLLLAWFAIPLVFFSLAGDKGDCYMIITAPAMAFAIAKQVVFF